MIQVQLEHNHHNQKSYTEKIVSILDKNLAFWYEKYSDSRTKVELTFPVRFMKICS